MKCNTDLSFNFQCPGAVKIFLGDESHSAFGIISPNASVGCKNPLLATAIAT